MTSKIKLPLPQALALAEKIKVILTPACERIEIAGSIRRRKAEVGDIEIVAISKYQTMPWAQIGLLTGEAEKEATLARLLENLVDEKPNLRWHPEKKNGDKFKKLQVHIGGDNWMTLDLFITTPEQWGLILAIRTGPDDFSKHIVTQAHKFGPLPPGFSVSGGWLHYNDQPVDIPEEEAFFDLLGYGWKPPEERGNFRSWQRMSKIKELV